MEKNHQSYNICVRATVSNFPASHIKILKIGLDHRVTRENSNRPCILDFFKNVFTLKGPKMAKNSLLRPESIFRPELVEERSLYKYKPLCEPRTRDSKTRSGSYIHFTCKYSYGFIFVFFIFIIIILFIINFYKDTKFFVFFQDKDVIYEK